MPPRAIRWSAALVALLGAAPSAAAATVEVAAEPGGLAAALAAAAPGDRLVLAAGRHEGPIVVDRALTLEGQPGAVLDGGGTGRVVTIDAPQVVLRGMTVTGSGRDLAVEDSGIFVTARAAGAVIEDNLIEGNLIGVNLKGPKAAIVRHNRIEGRHDLQMSERGNGVSIWNSPGSVVEANEISFGRDGIFVHHQPGATCSATTDFATCASPSTTCTPTRARSPATTRPATMSAMP